MDGARLIWGAPAWAPVAAGAAVVLLALLAWGYWRSRSDALVRVVAPALKALAILILALCLIEPLLGGTRARPGANLFIVLTDNSQSMTLRDRDATQTRAQQVQTLLGSATTRPWLSRLRQDFDVRQYAVDTQLRSVTSASELSFDGRASNLAGAIARVVERFRGRPLAGILLLSDGAATDGAELEKTVASRLPPVYPVVIGRDTPASDLGVSRVTVSQTSFEDAPVTLSAQVSGTGYSSKTLVAQLLDDQGKRVEQQNLSLQQDGKPATVRFQLRPQQPGVSFYSVRVAAEDELRQFDHPDQTAEATLANNTRLVAVDRGRGPYRVLYVAGRPNWEFKFLQRAVQEDDQVQLVGLLRIARREPKFNFLSRAGERTNPLYRGFNPAATQQAEEYDQPVLVRLNTQDEAELRAGFPKTADELYRYHAIILDDLEAEFFSQDQMQLIKEFVRQRGGGLLMLGGQESFRNGRFDRTPIGDLLPVYADQVPQAPQGARYRMVLTREGWLEPWVRLRPDEPGEQQRLSKMPGFQTINQIRGIKPGATVLAQAALDKSESAAVPALVEQRFGAGRVGALLIGDLWRWGLRRPQDAPADLGKAWRQTVRWLVADVPRRVEATVQREGSDATEGGEVHLAVDVRDPSFAPLDNASVNVHVTGPDGKNVDLTAESSSGQAGRYHATFVPRQPGAYRAEVTATAPDGAEVGKVQTGWTSDPAAEEFANLKMNRELLSRLATASGGQFVEPDKLDDFVASLPTRHAQITEPYVRPLWHTPWVFLLAIICLCAEWGLRRWRGLP